MAVQEGDGDHTAATTPDPTVLIVDDDKDLADTCEYWLRDEFSVCVAYSGQAALDTIDDAVDVVLLDRRMPGLSGDEVLTELRDRDFDCRVAMMTAVEPDTDIVEMAFDEYLVKPVDEQDVIGIVEELLVRGEFTETVREYFALESIETVLTNRDNGDLRDPAVLGEIKTQLDELRATQESAIKERERQLRRAREINSLLRAVDSALVDGTTRQELESAVCTSVVETGNYNGAWIARYDEVMNTFICQANAGSKVPTVDSEINNTNPVAESIQHALSDDSVRTVAKEVYDDDSAIVAPITYRDATYGALTVTLHGSASNEEQSVFDEIGERLGHGINAAESKRLLYEDAAVELELKHTDTRDVLIDLSVEFNTEVRLEGLSPTTDGVVSAYVAIDIADAETVLSVLSPLEAIIDARIVTDEPTEALFELQLADASVLLPLVEFGSAVESLIATDGSGSVTIRVPPQSDPRTIIDTIQSSFPDITVTAKRKVDDKVQSVSSFKRRLEETLTTRQLDVLETALASGYFEWPRDSTAEQVADSLGIAAPTFHEHLRSGERKLMQAFFAERKHARKSGRANSEMRATSMSTSETKTETETETGSHSHSDADASKVPTAENEVNSEFN